MTTLSTAPLLARLLRKPAGQRSPAMATPSREERARLMRSKTDDLLLLDGQSRSIRKSWALVENHLNPVALIVADNADYCPEYLERVRTPSGGYMSVPFAKVAELSMRVG